MAKEIIFNTDEAWRGALVYISDKYGVVFDVTDSGDDFLEESRYLETMATGSLDYMFTKAGQELKESGADEVTVEIPERIRIRVGRREGADDSDGNIGIGVDVLSELKTRVKNDAGL